MKAHTPSRKRNFVVDYNISGSMVIEAINASQAAWTARGRLNRSTGDLDAGSAYFEPEIDAPIDMQARYGLRAPGRAAISKASTP